MISSLTAFAAGGALLAPPLARASEQGVEELTRGPVHEAFAASVNFDPEPGILVKTAPPAAIEEVPPDQRPEGDNVSWIPGYWGWDDEQSDFIWISGVWRNLPPGRQWVPGYWGEVESQWQWTSGYWADEQAEEVTYVSKPPKSIESGPNIEAPSRNHIWVSGTWINREDRYAWRPGYWQPGQENWSWSPSHYQYTPRGYIYVDGYWDYNVARRGVVFAPVRFQHEYYDRPNYSYTPAVVIALGVFADHLFVRPNYGHYYYGDYYEPRYQREGFFASYSYSSGHRGYDPIYMQSRWQHRDDRDWERGRRENFAYYQSHEDARPPRTWAAMQSRPMAARQGQRDNYQFAQPLQQYASNSKGQRFQAVSAQNRTEIVEKNKQVRKFSQERKQMENRPNDRATEGADKRIQVKREKLEKSPVVGKRADQFSGNEAPPKRHEPKQAEARDPKNGGAEGKGGNKDGEPKNTERPDKGNRDGGAPAENGKGKEKNNDQPRGKNAEPTTKPDGKNDGRPDQKGEPKMKEKNQDNSRPEDGPNKSDNPNKAEKSDNPNRAKNEPDQPKKQAEQSEGKAKKEREPQAEQPKRQAEPQPKRQAEAQPKRQAEPEPKRQAEPQPKRQSEAQPKRQAEPQPKRQAEPEPKRQAEPQPKRQAEPQPKRQAEPQQQRQAKPEKEQSAPKESGPNKKKDKEEDPDAKKKN